MNLTEREIRRRHLWTRVELITQTSGTLEAAAKHDSSTSTAD